MAKIETDSVRIDLMARNITAFINVNKELSGNAINMSFFDGTMLLCKRKTDSLQWNYLIFVPSDEWIQDVKDMGYEVLMRLNDVQNFQKLSDFVETQSNL